VNAALPNAPGRMTLGAVLVVIGLVLTLDNAGVFAIHGLGRWWPLFVIGIGLVKVRQPVEEGQRAAGTALLFVGSLLQLVSVLSLVKGWPLIMVAVGGLLLWHAAENGPQPKVLPESPYLSSMALVGFQKRSLHTAAFRGGAITAVMGGVELDMRHVTMGDASARLDVVAFWGGIDLKVPAGWTVETNVMPLLGMLENKAQAPPESGVAKRLVVNGYAVMGAVLIAN
jgi:hypothetical protein